MLVVGLLLSVSFPMLFTVKVQFIFLFSLMNTYLSDSH